MRAVFRTQQLSVNWFDMEQNSLLKNVVEALLKLHSMVSDIQNLNVCKYVIFVKKSFLAMLPLNHGDLDPTWRPMRECGLNGQPTVAITNSELFGERK